MVLYTGPEIYDFSLNYTLPSVISQRSTRLILSCSTLRDGGILVVEETEQLFVVKFKDI